MSSNRENMFAVGDEIATSSIVSLGMQIIESIKLLNHRKQVFQHPSPLNRAGFRRKAIVVELNGKECYARPDTCSDQDIITEDFAQSLNITIQRGDEYRSGIQLGDGSVINTLGKAIARLKLPGVNTPQYRSFHVLEKCPVPLILGSAFIRQTSLFRKHKHLLVPYPFVFSTLPTFKFLGGSHERFELTGNGKLLYGVADTGSDLNFMSLRCAITNGFKIHSASTARTNIMLGDGSIIETIGRVNIREVEIKGYEAFEMEFHVLRGLPSDVVFGEEFIEEIGLFEKEDVWDTGIMVREKEGRLCTLVNLGPVQMFFTRLGRRTGKIGLKSLHGAENEDDVAVRRVYEARMANRRMGELGDSWEVHMKHGDEVDMLIVECDMETVEQRSLRSSKL